MADIPHGDSQKLNHSRGAAEATQRDIPRQLDSPAQVTIEPGRFPHIVESVNKTLFPRYLGSFFRKFNKPAQVVSYC
jgi:hypothetical protein